MNECQMAGCVHDAPEHPTYDANPDPAKRKQIGTVRICDQCQARIDKVNEHVRAS
jgi:hypothetical protein